MATSLGSFGALDPPEVSHYGLFLARALCYGGTRELRLSGIYTAAKSAAVVIAVDKKADRLFPGRINLFIISCLYFVHRSVVLFFQLFIRLRSLYSCRGARILTKVFLLQEEYHLFLTTLKTN